MLKYLQKFRKILKLLYITENFDCSKFYIVKINDKELNKFFELTFYLYEFISKIATMDDNVFKI